MNELHNRSVEDRRCHYRQRVGYGTSVIGSIRQDGLRLPWVDSGNRRCGWVSGSPLLGGNVPKPPFGS